MQEDYQAREQKLWQISEKILLKIWKDRVSSIERDYEGKGLSYENEFIEEMHKLLMRWEERYGCQNKNLKYIIISPLNSGVITRSYEMQVALFDEKLYADENPMCFYWVPEFLYKDVERDMNRYEEEASKEIIRLRKYEVNEIRRRYVLCHAYISMFFLDKAVKRLTELPVWERLRSEDIKILYGTYMEKMVEIGREG